MKAGEPIITRSKKRFSGRPYIAGTRITVDDIVDYSRILQDEVITQELLRAFPHLNKVQIKAALDYYKTHRKEIEVYLKEKRAALETHGQFLAQEATSKD